jgi:hypothetical protein
MYPYEIDFCPNLKSLGFEARMTAPQAWQELSMFVDGVMASAGTKEPKPITDELRAEIAGFDKKTSFRKMSGKQKLDRSTW